ncbi:MAG TPA: ACT domain-containing protein [Bryobacteraceae bacterium]|nr:ACT domain-containing protein [Bryobacteraceae bacterium]
MTDGGAKTDLDELLSHMEAELHPDEYVYCTVSQKQRGLPIDAICRFQEAEGETLIVRRTEAERNHLPFSFLCKRITLGVNSSLEAVGFLARIATELAEHGISANCVSAYYHDHLFVPAAQGERAALVLEDLQRRSRRPGG